MYKDIEARRQELETKKIEQSINDDVLIYNKMIQALKDLYNILEEKKGKKLTNHISNNLKSINDNIKMNITNNNGYKDIRLHIDHEPFIYTWMNWSGEVMTGSEYKVDKTNLVIRYLDPIINNDTLEAVRYELDYLNNKTNELLKLNYKEEHDKLQESYNKLQKLIDEHNKQTVVYEGFDKFYIKGY